MIRFLFILMVCLNINLFGCTIFLFQDENNVLAGNNCDTSWQPIKRMHIEPGNDFKYGALYFGSISYEQCGINEYGLFYANAMIPEWPETSYQPIGSICKEDVRKKIMQDCKTVEEAVKLINNYKTILFINHHMLIADKTGKSAIVEWNGNKLNIIWKKNNHQIATNFILSDVDENLISCKRYITAKEKLSSQNVSIEICRNVLDATHQKDTLYSIVADLKNGIIYLYLDHDYENVVRLNVIDELNKGQNYKINLSSFFESKKD